MRLLIALPSWNPGGADRTYLGPIVPAAISAGWDVHTACSSRMELRPLVEQLERDGATHHACEIAEQHKTGIGHVLQQRRFQRLIGGLLDHLHPDVVLLPIPWVSYGVGIMRACRDRRIPTATVFQLVKQGWPSWFRRRQFRDLLTTACRPVAVSENNRGIVSRMYGVPTGSIALIYNGIDATPQPTTEARTARTNRIRRDLGVQDRIMLLTAARLAPQKGQRDLLESIPRVGEAHPDAIFVLAGDGPDREILQAMARSKGISDQVRFLGRRDDVPDLLAAADAFVLPSVFEGSPFALVEAMHAGLPIVTTDASGISEVLRPDQDGLVVPAQDPERLAIAISTLLADPVNGERMANSARARAQSFTGGRMAEETLALLDTIAGAREP